jgi:hypothetical protein
MELLDLFPLLALVLILLLPFLYDSHGTFNYHSRFAFYIVSTSFTALICIPFFCLSPLNVKNAL